MAPSAHDYARLRSQMVDRQLRPRGISDPRVLRAMGSVPRDEFLPPSIADRAYADCALSIGLGQTISQPFIVALMTESLHLKGGERVLEVGTGSGYQAAVLAELCARIYTVERIPELSERARRLLTDTLGYRNVQFRIGDGTLGWPEEAPFDRIIVTAGAPAEPATLLDQLGPGGEAVAPVGGEHWQSLMHYSRDREGNVTNRALCDCVFVKLLGEEGW